MTHYIPLFFGVEKMYELEESDGRTIHLKLNPVGYPDENSGNAERMDEFLITR